MTYRRVVTEGLPDNANENVVDGLIRAEIGRLKLKFFRPVTVTKPDPQHLGQFIEVVEPVDTSAGNIAIIQAHVTEPVGQGTEDEKPGPNGENNNRKHWRLSTLQFLVDDQDNITHYLCERD